MDNKLQNLIELSRDPMMAVEDGRILCMNGAARSLFPKAEQGSDASEFLPQELLSQSAASFVSSAELRGGTYTVSARRDGETLLLSLFRTRSSRELRGCLSESLLSEMLSDLCNIGLAAERLTSGSEQKAAEDSDYLAAFYHNYYALDHRMNNLRCLCALSEGTMSVIPRYVDLAVLCRDTLASVRLLLGEASPELSFDCAEESLIACVDGPKVEQLILNLLSNAIKHTERGGSIRLGLAKNGKKAVLSVDDSGCGIPPDKLNNVFSGYELRLDERDLTDPGTGGLGLAISRAIAEKHGGTLILESREGIGTSVRVLLPLNRQEGTVLRSEQPPYENGGMRTLLSELCDVLPTAAYFPKYTD